MFSVEYNHHPPTLKAEKSHLWTSGNNRNSAKTRDFLLLRRYLNQGGENFTDNSLVERSMSALKKKNQKETQQCQ